MQENNRKFSNIRERLMYYLDSKDISKYSFYRSTGLSNGFLDKNSAMGSDKCEIIISVYPDLSLYWLVAGEGEMLRGQALSVSEGSKGVEVNSLKQQLDEVRELNEIYKERISKLKASLDDCEKAKSSLSKV